MCREPGLPVSNLPRKKKNAKSESKTWKPDPHDRGRKGIGDKPAPKKNPQKKPFEAFEEKGNLSGLTDGFDAAARLF